MHLCPLVTIKLAAILYNAEFPTSTDIYCYYLQQYCCKKPFHKYLLSWFTVNISNRNRIISASRTLSIIIFRKDLDLHLGNMSAGTDTGVRGMGDTGMENL